VILRAEVTMAGRKVRSADEARACLARAADSGMERAEWARVHGIDARSLNAWRLNLERGRRTAGVPAAPPLRLVELVPADARQQVSPAVYRVRHGPFVVEFGEDFDEQILRRLLVTVAAC
jgi:transposase-like protein